jgi:hypothetical protein
MNIAEYVSAALRDGSDGLRVHHNRLPRDNDSLRAVLPAIVISAVAGVDEMDLQGDAGLRRRLFQADSWATTRKGADDYMELARAKMLAANTFTVAAIDVSGAEGFDEDANLFRASLEFALWFNP